MVFDDLSELELYILKLDTRFKNISQATGSAYDWFFIIDEGVNKGNVTELRKQYVKDKTMDLTVQVSILEYLILTNQNYLLTHYDTYRTEKLGEHDFLPVLDHVRSKLLDKIKDEFRMKFKTKFHFLMCVKHW